MYAEFKLATDAKEAMTFVPCSVGARVYLQNDDTEREYVGIVDVEELYKVAAMCEWINDFNSD